ncbi:MAG TPA: imidazole glycerol phosphate synthase cyclase subunit [Hyphomicrobiaceae bacterium]|nr:imidazole glycerol phosphate synthase cyclase subunit [Hyphomicrobiaceae bacterium]
MSNLRLIARLDVKAPNLIKGIHLEGLRVIGDPNEFARKYYRAGADELIYIDIVASLYERNSLLDIVDKATREVFVPMTVGGGVRSIDDAKKLLRVGADKVAVNTAAVRRPELISEMAERFGAQCVVLSIEAKRTKSGGWEAFTDNGREHTGLDAIEWAKRGASLGAGEILVTSVDQEGTRKGFDVELTRKIVEAVPVPVIASGGMGSIAHMTEVATGAKPDAIAIADMLHYNRATLEDIRAGARAAGLAVRDTTVGAKAA